MDTQKRNNLIFQIVSYLFLMICLAGTIHFVRLKTNNTISADESSEMLLGEVLASEKSLVSKNWYYSTELEVFNTNVFYSFFFHITDNWHRVRLYATVSMYLVLLAVYYGMSRVFNFRKYFAVTAAILFIPFTGVYYHFILKGAYYFPVITTSLFTLLIAEWHLQLKGWKSHAMLAFSFIFAVVIGLGGMRQLFITYFPLFAASVILLVDKIKKSKSEKWFIFSAITFLGSVIGYIINSKILANIYHFDTWSDVQFCRLDFKQIGEVLDGFLASFGYRTGNIFSAALLYNAACAGWILLTAAAVWYALKYHREVSPAYFRLAVFTVCSCAVYIVFYSFTTMYHNPRYNIPIILLSLPLIALFIGQAAWKKTIKNGALAFFCLSLAASGLYYYVSTWNVDSTVQVRRIAKFLVTEGYNNGYATFWNANNLTEFSNGKLDVWSPVDGTHDWGLTIVTDIDQTYKFLQKVIHDTTHPAGKTFLLMTNGEAKNNNWKEYLKEEDVILRTSDYVLFGYEDYEHLIDTLYPGYDFVFGEDQWVKNGKDVNGHRELYKDGVSYGPNRTFWPGKHEIIIRGRNLSDSQTWCVYGPEERSVYIEPVEQDDQTLRFSFELTEKRYDVQIMVANISEDPRAVVEIDSISIRRMTDSE